MTVEKIFLACPEWWWAEGNRFTGSFYASTSCGFIPCLQERRLKNENNKKV